MRLPLDNKVYDDLFMAIDHASNTYYYTWAFLGLGLTKANAENIVLGPSQPNYQAQASLVEDKPVGPRAIGCAYFLFCKA
jgi:hypothetical protein